MPRITRKPNAQLRKIVLEETNDGRDVVRYLKSVIVDIEGAPQLYGLRAKDYARSHKIAAARILARLGLEEGKRYLRRNYVQTPFKKSPPRRRRRPQERHGRLHLRAVPSCQERDQRRQRNHHPLRRHNEGLLPRVQAPPAHGRGQRTHPPDRIRLRRRTYFASARPHQSTTPEPKSVSASESSNPSESNSDSRPTNPVYPTHPVNPDSDKELDTNQSNPEHPDSPVNPASDNPEITAHQPNHTNHSSDRRPKLITNPYRAYANLYCASEGESIYRSIVRRASDSANLGNAKYKAGELIADFNRFAKDCDPKHQPVSVPDDLLAKSLVQLREAPETYVFDPDDYYDLELDEFYYCLCRYCEECDELDYYFETMRELEEDTDYPYEDP